MSELVYLPARLEADQQANREHLEAFRRETREQLEAYQQETRERFERLENAIAQLMEAVAESRRVEQRLEAGLEESRRIERELREAIEDLRQTTQQIAEEQKQMRQVQEKLLKDVGILKGSARERYYRERAHAILGRYLRKVQLINMGDLLDEIESRTEISDEEADELMSVEAIFSAVKKKTREPVYVVLEASWVVDESDMERAIRRAAILQRLGYPAVPVVGGVEVATPVIRAATEGSVVLALDGKVLGETLLA